ncbi:MAG: hypothetical protein ACREJG_03710 [Candidatus Rokuibacteriota bacterium]
MVRTVVLLAALAVLPPDAFAQGVEAQRRRVVVHPAPAPATAARAAAETIDRLRQAQRAERTARESLPAVPERRPDLDHDVTSGIQAQNLHRARPR